jgi:mannosyltransferase OCH1-like enzyme
MWLNDIIGLFFSDVIRLILITKYGGWYSDLDLVFLRKITSLTNVAASDNFFDKDKKVLMEDHGL